MKTHTQRRDYVSEVLARVDKPMLRIMFISVVLAHTVYAIMLLLPESTADVVMPPAEHPPVERPLMAYAMIHNFTDDYLSGITSTRLDMLIYGIVDRNKELMRQLNTTCAAPWMELIAGPAPAPGDPLRDYWNVLTLQPAPDTYVTLYNAAIVSHSPDKTLMFTNHRLKSTRHTRTFSNHVVLSHAYGMYNATQQNVSFCIQELY